MDDLIRRSDAIKAAWGAEDINPSEDGQVFEAQSHIDRDIRLIPAVESCKDIVSREWLLNELEEMYGQMKRMIKVAPSVTVKPKHGEWIYPSDVSGFGRCENCNALWGKDLIDNIFFIHCPRCGAKMKGADDE